MMPILLQVCVEGNTGSTGRIAEEIGILAMNKGLESHIAFGRFPRASKSQLIRIGTYFGIYFHVLITRLFDMHCFASGSATKVLIKKIEQIKPDIIHLHHLHGYYINIDILFKYLKKSNIPVIWTFHDCWSITGHCIHFEYVGCYKWKKVCYDCPQKREYPASLFLDRSRKNFYRKRALFTSVPNLVIVTASDWLRGIVKESFMRDIPVYTINNGIDLSIFTPSQNGGEIRKKYNLTGCFIILGVASPWTDKKGFSDFIKLGALLDKDEVIILVGLRKAQIKKLPGNIIGIAKTENRQELVDIYSEADIFVNPTWEDNFPTTNLESLACGTPVVTYRTGGSIEAVSQNTGFIVEKGDLTGLIKIIRQVKNSCKQVFSAACRERAVQYFSKDDRFSEYLDLYDSLLGTRD